MQENGRLGILEALKPIVVVNDLEAKTNNCKDKMVLCKLKKENQQIIENKMEKFNSCVNFYVGQKYNTLGAVLSGIDLLPDNSFLSRWLNKFRKAMHCSHLDSEIKRVVGILPENTLTKEITPQDCYEMNIWSEKIIIKQ